MLVDAYAAAIARPDPSLDAIAHAAASALDMPIARIALLSARRQLLLSQSGAPAGAATDCVTTEFCTQTIGASTPPFVIQDTLLDQRFAETALVTGPLKIRFYAGVPLLGREGLPLGTLSVLDIEARHPTPPHLELLRHLGSAISAILDYHRHGHDGHDNVQNAETGEDDAVMRWTCREDGTIVDMDPRFGALAGAAPDGEPCIDWISVVHPMQQDAIRARWMMTIDSRIPFEAEFRTNDQGGAIGWMQARVAPNDAEATGLWRGLLRHVSADRPSASRSDYLSSHDVLTGLSNRFCFETELKRATQKAIHGTPFALFCLDLDNFKLVNDTMGHHAGDMLLCGIADRLRMCVRHNDLVARLGGDEFVIIQAGVSRPSDAEQLAQRLSRELRVPMQIDGHAIVVSASIGVALCPRDGNHNQTLLQNADTALYRAKGEGRGIFRFFKPTMDSAATSRRAMKFDLRHALERDELSLVFQPIVSMADNRASSVEALLRWRHPSRGIVSPGDFIPVAEATGLIRSIGPWALRQACLAGAGWNSDLRISVNLSPKQFQVDDIFEMVSRILQETQLNATRLELEITETLPLLTDRRNVDTLRRLRELGVRTVLDDFGTGYSSLTYLRMFPFDKIKLDRAFTASMSQREGLAIARAIIRLARDLGIQVTAEGVETAEQLDQVRHEGCDEAQGYFIARPMRAIRIPRSLRLIEEGLIRPA